MCCIPLTHGALARSSKDRACAHPHLSFSLFRKRFRVRIQGMSGTVAAARHLRACGTGPPSRRRRRRATAGPGPATGQHCAAYHSRTQHRSAHARTGLGRADAGGMWRAGSCLGLWLGCAAPACLRNRASFSSQKSSRNFWSRSGHKKRPSALLCPPLMCSSNHSRVMGSPPLYPCAPLTPY